MLVKMKKQMIQILAASAAAVLLIPNAAFAGEWKRGMAPNEERWWYDYQDSSYAASGWQWLDGNEDGIAECYYFDENGWMLADTVTPDGYMVNEDGAWIQDGQAVTKSLGILPTAAGQGETQEKDSSRIPITVTMGNRHFDAYLYDNAATKALAEYFPLTLTMNELNGNEKYHYMDVELPTDVQRIGEIHTGDLMLYGSDCVVLFYEDFQTSYRYTRLGYLEHPEELAETLGNGTVSVTLEMR